MAAKWNARARKAGQDAEATRTKTKCSLTFGVWDHNGREIERTPAPGWKNAERIEKRFIVYIYFFMCKRTDHL